MCVWRQKKIKVLFLFLKTENNTYITVGSVSVPTDILQNINSIRLNTFLFLCAARSYVFCFYIQKMCFYNTWEAVNNWSFLGHNLNFESWEYIIYEKYFQLKKVLDMNGNYYRKLLKGNTSKAT